MPPIHLLLPSVVSRELSGVTELWLRAQPAPICTCRARPRLGVIVWQERSLLQQPKRDRFRFGSTTFAPARRASAQTCRREQPARLAC